MELGPLAISIANQFIEDTNNDGNLDLNETIGSFSRLLSDSDMPFDLNGIVAKLQNSGMSDIVSSWLGDGENAAIDSSQVAEIFGAEKVNEFANSLNLDSQAVGDSLSKLIPQLIDQSSTGGQLNEISLSGITDLFASQDSSLGDIAGTLGGLFSDKS